MKIKTRSIKGDVNLREYELNPDQLLKLKKELKRQPMIRESFGLETLAVYFGEALAGYIFGETLHNIIEGD